MRRSHTTAILSALDGFSSPSSMRPCSHEVTKSRGRWRGAGSTTRRAINSSRSCCCSTRASVNVHSSMRSTAFRLRCAGTSPATGSGVCSFRASRFHDTSSSSLSLATPDTGRDTNRPSDCACVRTYESRVYRSMLGRVGESVGARRRRHPRSLAALRLVSTCVRMVSILTPI